MYFDDLERALVGNLRLRAYNGEFTERQLAKLARVSQPHIHNVLKGVKALSNELSDRILKVLGITILDLMDPERLAGWVRDHDPGETPQSFLRVLDGLIGPGQAWPMKVGGWRPFPIRPVELARLGYPVAGRLAEDPSMRPVFSAGDWVVLDQAQSVRTELDEGSYYLLKLRGEPLIRRVRTLGGALHIVTEETAHNPDAWERIEIEAGSLTRLVRARACFLPPATDWWEPEDFLFQVGRATSR